MLETKHLANLQSAYMEAPRIHKRAPTRQITTSLSPKTGWRSCIIITCVCSNTKHTHTECALYYLIIGATNLVFATRHSVGFQITHSIATFLMSHNARQVGRRGAFECIVDADSQTWPPQGAVKALRPFTQFTPGIIKQKIRRSSCWYYSIIDS